MGVIFSICVAYLVGSIPNGYLIVRFFKKVDIRTTGSGNIGATNVFRSLGMWPGIATLVLDILKGLLPVLVVRALMPGQPLVHIVVGFAAIAGHNWSIFLNFTGGKGVATSAGVFFGLLPGPSLVSLIVFVVVLASSNYVSLASMSAAAVLPLAAAVFSRSLTIFIFTSLITGVILYKHIPNIKRLKAGNESTFEFRKQVLDRIFKFIRSRNI